MIKKYKETILYLFFGILSTIVNISIYYIFTRIFTINETISNIIAWFFAVLFAFVTNKFFVFENKEKNLKHISKEFLLFFNCRLFSGFIDICLMWILIKLLFINDIVAKITTNFIVIIINYIFSKMIIFKK